MASYTTSEIRSGMKVILEGDPYAIVDNEFVKPGKGQAFNRIKVRNLKNGRTIERTFRSGESLEAADVMDAEMQYLYNDGSFWHFMVPENFEQYSAGPEVIGDNARVAQGRHELHRHALEQCPARGNAARRTSSSRSSRPILACAATPPPAVRRPRSSRPARSCECRCSSTKAKSFASIPAPASYISRAK